jgi:hypothetical protein
VTLNTVIKLWNDILEPLGFRKVAKATPERGKHFNARLNDDTRRCSLAWWNALFHDVSTYGIKPERVKPRNPDRIQEMDSLHRNFFELDRDGYSRRVELNAFTTEQLLEIIHDKLKDKKSLPKLDISDALRINEQKIKDYVLFQLVKSKYGKMLSDVAIDDLPGGEMTYHEMIQRMPSIEKRIMAEMSAKIEKGLEKMEATA